MMILLWSVAALRVVGDIPFEFFVLFSLNDNKIRGSSTHLLFAFYPLQLFGCINIALLVFVLKPKKYLLFALKRICDVMASALSYQYFWEYYARIHFDNLWWTQVYRSEN